MSTTASSSQLVLADTVDAGRVERLALSLGLAVPLELPPLWHWILFQDWVAADQVGADGHPRRGGFLPALPELERRMWAGGDVVLHGPLTVGQAVTRSSVVESVHEKAGGSGRLVFVTVRHRIEGPQGLAIEERQDLVYRSAQGAAVKAPSAAPPAPVSAIGRVVVPDPVLLFRYSALTGNGHRIHYDQDYARGIEGYPGLVVHGPLQATWLAGLLGDRVRRFAFRGRCPAFHGEPLALEAWNAGERWTLRTLDASGAICMEAEAELG